MFQVVCRNYTNTDTQARRAPPQHTQTHRAKLLRFSTASPILIQDYHFHKIKKKKKRFPLHPPPPCFFSEKWIADPVFMDMEQTMGG